MKKQLWILLLPVLFFACSRKIPTTTGNGSLLLTLKHLKSDNISEEVTGNDEIHLMAWLVNPDNYRDSIPTRIVLREWQDSLVFYKRQLNEYQELKIKDSIYSIEKTNLVLLIMEVDTERPFDERASQVRTIMQQYNYQKHDSLQTQLSKAILDDDLLYLSFHKLSTFQQNIPGEIIFSGNHLFDRYFYRIGYLLEKK